MNKALPARWESLLEGSIDRGPELERLLNTLIESDQRAIVLEGPPGSGKTTLAAQFVYTFRERFPGGIEFRTGAGEPDEFLAPATGTGDRLLIFDALDNVWPGADWAADYLQSRLAEDAQLRILMTSRRIPQIERFERVAVPPMDIAQISEMLRQGMPRDELPPQQLLLLADGSPMIAAAIVEAARVSANWSELIARLSSFKRPGLVDRHGRPLRNGSASAKTFLTGVREVNDWIMQRLKQDPEIVHLLSPRQFEELSAELFTRLGFDVELTPASRDGGKDLILLKRSDLGTMMTYVECKRYAPNQSVGVAVVRALHGVVERGRATSGIVLTSSRFTKGALEYQEDIKYRISLKDYADFKGLIDKSINGSI
ncbi:restriction system protein [Sphingopyxis sp. YR583]|uniref:restriction endonuclease n=1 Tax=Sphingopyxis sp. YR583 TaxID=1881047 RepID=UPI0008A757AA|nr:restriction endonuclease [Sphingopyxis sp. YR583]SEH15051.1 restriction system protein [Sphingopyxis sp. YR583]